MQAGDTSTSTPSEQRTAAGRPWPQQGGAPPLQAAAAGRPVRRARQRCGAAPPPCRLQARGDADVWPARHCSRARYIRTGSSRHRQHTGAGVWLPGKVVPQRPANSQGSLQDGQRKRLRRGQGASSRSSRMLLAARRGVRCSRDVSGLLPAHSKAVGRYSQCRRGGRQRRPTWSRPAQLTRMRSSRAAAGAVGAAVLLSPAFRGGPLARVLLPGLPVRLLGLLCSQPLKVGGRTGRRQAGRCGC